MSLEHSPGRSGSGCRIVRWNEVAKRLGVHKATAQRWATRPEYAHLMFPQPVQVGDGFSGILDHELDAWMRSRPRVSRGDYEA